MTQHKKATANRITDARKGTSRCRPSAALGAASTGMPSPARNMTTGYVDMLIPFFSPVIHDHAGYSISARTTQRSRNTGVNLSTGCNNPKTGIYRKRNGAAEKTNHHCVSPDFCQILTPENVQNKGACITVCITAAGSRVAKRTLGMCPGGMPSRFARQARRSTPEGCLTAI